jgi:tRNA(fMet)-specific endonuclease VapC
MNNQQQPLTEINRRIVDTCIVSYLLKNHSLAQQYRPLLEGKSLGLSFMSKAELYRWSIERGWGKKKMQQLENMLKNYVILSCDDETCWYWAKISAIKGRPMPYGDAWIAATALRYDAPLITHNVKDFEHLQSLGLSVISVPVSKENSPKHDSKSV